MNVMCSGENITDTTTININNPFLKFSFFIEGMNDSFILRDVDKDFHNLRDYLCSGQKNSIIDTLLRTETNLSLTNYNSDHYKEDLLHDKKTLIPALEFPKSSSSFPKQSLSIFEIIKIENKEIKKLLKLKKTKETDTQNSKEKIIESNHKIFIERCRKFDFDSCLKKINANIYKCLRLTIQSILEKLKVKIDIKNIFSQKCLVENVDLTELKIVINSTLSEIILSDLFTLDSKSCIFTIQNNSSKIENIKIILSIKELHPLLNLKFFEFFNEYYLKSSVRRDKINKIYKKEKINYAYKYYYLDKGFVDSVIKSKGKFEKPFVAYIDKKYNFFGKANNWTFQGLINNLRKYENPISVIRSIKINEKYKL